MQINKIIWNIPMNNDSENSSWHFLSKFVLCKMACLEVHIKQSGNLEGMQLRKLSNKFYHAHVIFCYVFNNL